MGGNVFRDVRDQLSGQGNDFRTSLGKAGEHTWAHTLVVYCGATHDAIDDCGTRVRVAGMKPQLLPACSVCAIQWSTTASHRVRSCLRYSWSHRNDPGTDCKLQRSWHIPSTKDASWYSAESLSKVRYGDHIRRKTGSRWHSRSYRTDVSQLRWQRSDIQGASSENCPGSETRKRDAAPDEWGSSQFLWNASQSHWVGGWWYHHYSVASRDYHHTRSQIKSDSSTARNTSRCCAVLAQPEPLSPLTQGLLQSGLWKMMGL